MPNVFVNSILAGSLERDQIAHRFTYSPDVAPSNAVSLLMPVGATDPYVAEMPTRLHPIFDMNLPEGALRDTLQRLFAKALPSFDDFALLNVVGGSLIGRLRFSANNTAPASPKPENLKGLLETRGTHALFQNLVTRYAEYSGISGVQPKLLVRDDGSLLTSELSPALTPSSRITFPSTTHILKAFDAEKYPEMAMNEYICLTAASKAGLPVPKFSLAADGGLLAVERFDLKSDGNYLGFEDTCALAGRVSREKYEGSYEQVAKTLGSAIRGPDGANPDLQRFFKMLVLSVVVRNGDAHRKNFGVLYDDAAAGPVKLAPAYDILTTVAYVPSDSMALTLDGTKRWPDARRLVRFALARCQLTQKQAEAAIDQVTQAVSDTRQEIGKIESADVRAQMASAWEGGLNSTAITAKVTPTKPSKVRADLPPAKSPRQKISPK